MRERSSVRFCPSVGKCVYPSGMGMGSLVLINQRSLGSTVGLEAAILLLGPSALHSGVLCLILLLGPCLNGDFTAWRQKS